MDKDELGLSLNTNVNIETEPEYIEMDKLALSAPLEFLSKYNSPKEWILEQEEAERSRVWNGPAQVGPFEKAQYGVGQAIYEFERAPSEFLQVGAGLYKGLYDLFFPNSTETALDRFYNSLALSNLENRERREDLVKAYTGEDSDIVDWSSAIAQLGLIMASAGIGAGIGAQAARQGINKLATETAKGVATRPAVIRRATQIAARKGAQTGGIATTIGTMFPQEAGSSALESVRQYIAQTGDTNLKNYKPGADSLTALAVGTINSAIEVGFGVERYIPEFWGTNTNFNRAARRFVEGTLGEGAEEFTQSLVSQIGEIVNGYRDDIDWNEAWHNALIGGVLGGAAGSGMYYLNRRRMARQVANDYNMPYKKAAALVDEMLGTGIESTTNELSARSELLNARGNAWDKMVTGVKTAMETVDFGDEQARNNQASQFAKTNVAIAIREAQKAGLSTDEFLDIAEFETVNNGQNLNMVFLKPLGSVQDIDNRIKAQDEIINRQKELKKTGADDKDAMRLAKQRKAILQKAKAIKQYNDAQYQEQIKANTTPETAQEIETATKDVESVKGATQAEFDSKVDTENLTSAEKSKRYGNAVLKSILPTKTSFDAVMVDPIYANAKQAIIAVADRINSFIKAHRTYGLKTDIANALQKMQTVNQGNFIDSVTTPDLDGVDVIAENAFLYHFLFSDATTIQTFMDSYITRAEDSLNQKKGKLSKKDLVGQSFKATDNAMQTQAQVIGAEYTSIYNEDGSYADKNVMAVMLSYQNQFVQEQPRIQTIEYSDSEVLGIFAKAKNNGDITLDNWENVRWSSLLSAGDTYQKGKRNKPATEAEKAKFARKMLDKYIPNWNKPTQQLLEQFDLADENARLDDIYPAYDGETIEVDGKERTVYNSNGDRIAKSKEALTNFWRWFGDSKVVDEQGRPLVVYHGTDAEFDTFDMLKGRSTMDIQGAFFSPWELDSKGYGSNVRAFYIKLEKPASEGIAYKELNKHKGQTGAGTMARESLVSMGYDGVDNSGEEYIVFKPENIKSVDNRGTYSADTGNIYYQTEVYDGLITTKIWNVMRTLRGLKDSSTERLLYDKQKDIWFLENADDATHVQMFIKAFNQGNYPEFNNEREAEQYFQENYLADDQNLLQFLAQKYDRPEDAKQAMEHTLGTDEYTNAYLRNNLVVYSRYETDLSETDFPLETFDHYKVEYDENNNREIKLVEKAKESYVEPVKDKPIDPRDRIPKVRGGWTKEKILRYLKNYGSHAGAGIAAREIANFDSVEDFMNHVFYHGARYGTSGRMQPSIVMSDREIERIGGGGYGEKYWAISITKSKKVAGNFATSMGGGNIYPVLLAKNAKVIEMPELTDSADLDDHIVDLYEKGVDAVWIGDKNAGEQELAVINPRALINIGRSEYYGAYKLGSEENPIRLNTKEDFQRIFDFAKDYKNKDETTRFEEAKRTVLWQGKKANGFYDPELGVIVLGRNMNEMTLPHEMQHYWLDKIFSIYKRAKSGELQVRDEWMTETKALFDMLGIDENQTQLTEGQQEKFARMSEAYLTGIGVTGDMNATFKEYQQWVPEKYKSILNLGYLSDDGKVEYPFLDQGAVDFFNKWYANYSLPSLATSPERQEFVNPEDQNGEVLPVSIKEMNNRDKEFGNDAEEQVKTDQRLYNTLDENMSAEIKVEADGQKVVQASRSNFLKESEKQQRRWFERKSRDTEAQMAQDYIEKNPEHAKEVVFGDPELIPNDTGIDRATLINAYMALNNITPESEDWATLQTNIAINQSLAGTQLALSNNTSYRTYLDALREIENAREMKAATNYAGAKQGAVERFNRDIQRFVDEELPKVLATAPNTEARDIALKSMFERARTQFSGNTTGGVLNQMDFDYARGQKGASAAFTRWAVNQIKKDAGAKLNGQEQAHLLNLSAKAQQAVIDLDDRDTGKAVAGAQEIRKWQVEKDKLMGVKPQKFSLFGDYAPRAMLASFNTLVVSNIPSTAMNTAVVRMLESGIFGKNEVSESLTDSEIKRIKAIYGATAMNLAQMERPTSPSLLHGEKYSASGQKWYDPFTILGKEDNWFRVPTFVNTLARIATQDAKAIGKNADDVFKEYCRLENQSDAAKLARKQALAVSNMAVFTQDGSLARALNGIRDWLNKGSRALVGLDPNGFGVGTLISPFLKTGANIAEMGFRGSIAPITTISALVQSWRSGKAIDPMKKLALAMDWTYFLMSSVMVALLAALTSDDDEFYTEPYEMGKTYDPDKPYDSINIAGVWIDLDFFGPFAIPIRTGCRLVQQWKKDNLSAIYKAYGQGAKYAAMDTPLLESIFNNQMGYAVKKPEDWATGWAYNQANKLIPAQIKPLSRAISSGKELDMGWAGKVIERKFHRNYGWSGAELTTQDLIDIFSTKFTYQP